MEAEPGLEPE